MAFGTVVYFGVVLFFVLSAHVGMLLCQEKGRVKQPKINKRV